MNGRIVMYRLSESVYRAMLWRMQSYTIPSKGAEQDLLTDFFKEYFRDITPLPRSYNWQVHIAMLTGHFEPLGSWYNTTVDNWEHEVRN